MVAETNQIAEILTHIDKGTWVILLIVGYFIYKCINKLRREHTKLLKNLIEITTSLKYTQKDVEKLEDKVNNLDKDLDQTKIHLTRLEASRDL